MARTRSPAHDDQRERILEQAAALFAQSGYTATTMNQVAAACGVSKATLYHYWRDKHALLAQIAIAHVARLEALVGQVAAERSDARARLRDLILRFVGAYADAQHQHRVLTEDVKFLAARERKQVLDAERRVVAGFAETVAALRPDLQRAALTKPLTMLLFGMINWMFTWFRPGGALTHETLAPIVAEVFIAGLQALRAPRASEPKTAPQRSPNSRARRAAML